tara:strand:+ start:326 stop:1504 length:1179 start_codon:yes stop_codon:yes gene_type:complete
MNYILFEKDTERIRPFSDLHASFELMTGAFDNFQRLIRSISKNDTIQLFVRQDIEDLIKHKYPDFDVNPDYFEPGVYLNGDCLWYPEDLTLIKNNRSYSNINGIVSFHTDLKISLNDLSSYINQQSQVSTKLDSVISIKYLWEIFDILNQSIGLDFSLMNTSKQGNIHPSCIFIKDENIIINDKAIVSAGVVLDASEGPIVIDSNSFIDIGSLIKGPVYIGTNTKINPGTKLNGSVSIGSFCKIGGEVEDSVIQGFSNKQHDGFLGHSYVGEWVNLGANTNTSDLKNNYSKVKVFTKKDDFIDTDKMFIGSIIGDFTRTAIGTKLNTGTYIGVGSNLFDDGFQDKFIPSFSWGKNDRIGLNRFIKSIDKAMNRRNCKMPDTLKNRIIAIYKK